MTFSSRIIAAPIAFSSERAADVLPLYADLPPETREVIGGTAGCSMFLCGILEREVDWVSPALSRAPEDVFDDLIASLLALSADQLRVELRVAKRRVAVLAGLCDVAGVWSLEQVTSALTDFADVATDLAVKSQVEIEIMRGKIPGATHDDIPTAAGMVALAMGKMGAHELNYSSDIDLICLFDDSRYDPSDTFEARAAFVRATRRASAILNDKTGDGYVFRTDLRLRPDPSVTPVCVGMEAAERYYEGLGRTWERAAHIKARPCGGDMAAGEAYLKRLRPFVWRRHLDYAAIQDAHDMRLRIRDHKGLGGALTLEGHNMKLGRGGIREIEFFTQTGQLIAGGRNKLLRGRETVPMLGALAQANWIEDDVADILTRHYRAHRTIEHRLQMVNDAQTHDLPKDADGFRRLANFMGEGDVDALRRDLTDRLEEVHSLTEGFFAPTPRGEPAPVDVPDIYSEVMERWQGYPALRSPRALEIFERLKPELITRLERAARPEEALNQFDGFLAGLPAGVQLLSMFEANPQLIDLMVDIASTSPALAGYLSRNARVFDAVIGGEFFAPWPDHTALLASLNGDIPMGSDYEARLDAARRWQKEWHFRVGVHHLRGLIDAETAGHQYAALAEITLRGLWPVVVAEFARKHGDLPGRGACVVAMGSLGVGRLHAQSDLDLIMIYDDAGVDMSDGPRPLATRAYYARLTQAFVTAVSVPMAEGRLYEVDMRLRPSGRRGPVATSLAAFKSYQENEAWTWEHLALTRARVIAGDDGVARDIETFRVAILPDKGAGATVMQDLSEMRHKISQAKTGDGPLEAKIGAGRLQDIELAAQGMALLAGHTERATRGQIRSGALSPTDEATLIDGYKLMWRLQVASKLLSEGWVDPVKIGQGGRDFILRETDQTSQEGLLNAIDTAAHGAEDVIARLLRPTET